MATGRHGPRLWGLSSREVAENGTIVLVLEGRLGHATAGELKAIVEHAANTSKEVVLDLSGVDYLSSAALQVIAACRLTVRAPSPAARLSLELAGLSHRTR
jgi:anti-anti-sigma factor